MSLKMEMKIDGVDGVLSMLSKLPPEVVSKRGGPVRSALRRAAMIIVKQARSNFSTAVAMPGRSGITDTTGFTEKNIITKRSKPPSGVKGEKFVVTVRYIHHPSGNPYRKGRIRANDIAFIMEYGTEKQPAIPWLRPAYESKRDEVLRFATQDLVDQIDKVVTRLMRQGGA